MAKKQKREVVRIKWMGLACFGIAVALFALAIWGGNLITNANNNIFGYTVEYFSNTENIVAIFEDSVISEILAFFMTMLILLFSMFASLKVLFMFFNILGFIGRKDAYKTAKKFSKFVKRAFAAIGLEITALILFSLDDGIFAKEIITFFVVVGVAFAVLYLGTRAYRWLLVEKMPVLDMVFILIKDCIYVGLVVYILSLLDTKLLTSFIHIETLFDIPMSSLVMSDMMYSYMFKLGLDFFIFFVGTSLTRKTLSRFTLNNYKKSAYRPYLGGYITLLIVAIITNVFAKLVIPLVDQTVASVDFTALILSVIPKIIPYVAAILAVAFAGSIEGGYVKEIKLYIPCAKTNKLAVEPANEETVEETASEEVVEDAVNEDAPVEETVEDGTQEFEEPTEQPIEEPANEPAPKKRGRKPKVSE